MKFREKPYIEYGFRELTITAKVDASAVQEVAEIAEKIKPGTEYRVELRTARRSLNANAYHWLLVGEIAGRMGLSKSEVHNMLLADYGVDWADSNGELQMVALADGTPYQKNEKLHLRATSETFEKGGTVYRWFILLLPSHLMDTQQMSRLIDGTVQEAQALGIRTEPDQRLAEMKKSWQK